MCEQHHICKPEAASTAAHVSEEELTWLQRLANVPAFKDVHVEDTKTLMRDIKCSFGLLLVSTGNLLLASYVGTV